MPKELIVPRTKKCDNQGLISDEGSSIFNNIGQPIEHRPHDSRGEAWAVLKHGRPLTNRQQAVLDKLPDFDSRATFKKSDVSMPDLAALTAKTGSEFAIFTRGPERLVVRGDRSHVNIGMVEAAAMRAQGYKWSGHTHIDGLVASHGDRMVLEGFNQASSVIYSADGKRGRFFRY